MFHASNLTGTVKMSCSVSGQKRHENLPPHISQIWGVVLKPAFLIYCWTWSSDKIPVLIKNVYWDSANSLWTIKYCRAEFNRSRTRSSRLSKWGLFKNDRESLRHSDRIVKVRETARTMGMSTEWVHNILTTQLDGQSLSAWRASRLLINDSKNIHICSAKHCLAMLILNWNEF